MFGKEKYREYNWLLNKKLAEKKVLIAVHRGSFGANIIQNTVPAYKNAVNMGGDLIEVDAIASTDGVLYAFHDGAEEATWRVKKDIKQMDSREIESYPTYNSLGHACRYRVERISAILESFCQGELINIDRAWDIFPQVIQLLEEYPHAKAQVILKAPVIDEVLEFLNSCEQKYMFMPIAYSLADVEKVMSYQDINLVGIEGIAAAKTSELFLDENVARIKAAGLFLWANAITLEDDVFLFGGYDDNISILEDPDKGWGKLMEKGVDIIQTDWPALLFNYRESYFKS